MPIDKFTTGGKEFRDHLDELVDSANDHEKRLVDLENGGNGDLVTSLVVVDGIVYFAEMRMHITQEVAS